jgi:hypothetical protein
MHLTMPTSTLLDPRKRYTPAANTDIRRTFAAFHRLARMQARTQQDTKGQP